MLKKKMGAGGLTEELGFDNVRNSLVLVVKTNPQPFVIE
jgi:hypothetical protein